MKYPELKNKALKLLESHKKEPLVLTFPKHIKSLDLEKFIESHLMYLGRFQERKKGLNKHTVNAYFDRLKQFVDEHEK